MVDMAIEPEELQEGMETPSPIYPYGLCISLTEKDLGRLELDADCEVGDLLHMVSMSRVTSVSKNENGCRIEMQIIDIEVLEDETEEFKPRIDTSKFYKG